MKDSSLISIRAIVSSSSQIKLSATKAVAMARRKFPILYTRIFVIGLVIFILGLLWLENPFENSGMSFTKSLPEFLTRIDEKVIISSDSPYAGERDANCTYHNFTCIEVYKCGYDDSSTVSVYIYPIQQFYDENGADITPPMSREFETILQTIAESPYHSHDPDTACLFVPSIDLLNENLVNPRHVSQILASLTWYVGRRIEVLDRINQLDLKQDFLIYI